MHLAGRYDAGICSFAIAAETRRNGKLSKRDGDRLGFPVFPLEWHDPKSGEVSSGYRESGYLPEAVINFLALLGWNPGNDQEIMSMDELIKLFDLTVVVSWCQV